MLLTPELHQSGRTKIGICYHKDGFLNAKTTYVFINDLTKHIEIIKRRGPDNADLVIEITVVHNVGINLQLSGTPLG